MAVDFGGAEGGRLAQAFAAGCVACFVFCAGVGKFIWGAVGKAKDDEIKRLREEQEDDRRRCAAMETRLVQRIQQLEGFILALSPPGNLRQQIQTVISEQRVAEDVAHKR